MYCMMMDNVKRKSHCQYNQAIPSSFALPVDLLLIRFLTNSFEAFGSKTSVFCSVFKPGLFSLHSSPLLSDECSSRQLHICQAAVLNRKFFQNAVRTRWYTCTPLCELTPDPICSCRISVQKVSDTKIPPNDQSNRYKEIDKITLVCGVWTGKIFSRSLNWISLIWVSANASSTSPRSTFPRASLKPSLLLQSTSFGSKSWKALRSKNFSVFFGISLKLQR